MRPLPPAIGHAILLLLALVALAACHLSASTVPGPSGGRESGTTSQPVQYPQAAEHGTADQVRMGTLRLVIKWPERDRPWFRAQLIPASTRALGLWVWSGLPGAGTLLRGPVLVARQDGIATVSVDIQLPEGRNFSLECKAYREANPDFNLASAIAQGTASGFNITWGEVSSTRIVLDAVSVVPTISSMDTNVGAPGQTVTISGTNLGPVEGATPSVAFNGATASVVVPVSRTVLRVVVPADAATGRVVVTSDGLSSSSAASFWVLGSFSLVATRSAWDPSPGTGRIVVVGQTLLFHGVPGAFVAKTGDDLAQYGASPSATMSVGGLLDNPAAGSFPASGSFLAGNAVASSSLRALLGSLPSTNSVQLSVEDVVGASIAPATADVGGAQNLQQVFAGLNILTSGATNSVVRYSSSDPASVSIDAGSGLARAVGSPLATASVTVSAVSRYRDTLLATASVRLLPCSGPLCTATLISLGVTYDGSISVAGEMDYYRFVLSAARSIAGQTYGTTDTYCYLKDGNGVNLASDDDAGAGNNCYITSNLSAGTYYFAVRHYDSTGTGNYQVRVD